MHDSIADRVTYAVATAGIASPLWLPSLEEASKFAAHLLPILGVVWLLVQIWVKLRKG